jgi:hypothetical protein
MKKGFTALWVLAMLAVVLVGCTNRIGSWSISGSHTGDRYNGT